MTPFAPTGPAYLFCPGNRPERFARAAAAADVVIIDLEDAVPPHLREEARRHVVAAHLDPATTIIRVNPVATPDHERDVAAVTDSAFSTVMLAKASSANEVRSLDRFEVVALCETPGGVAAAEEIAGCDNTVGLMWGSEDLVSALGGYSSRLPNGAWRDVARYARARILIAAGMHHLVALDAVNLNFGDLDALRAEATDAAAMGFSGTACVHPTQVAVVREAFSPSDSQVKWASEILEAAEGHQGVFRLGGIMVDGPVLVQAQRILSRVLRPS